jgi:hypothetical protein
VIKFVSDFRQVGCFLRVLRFLPSAVTSDKAYQLLAHGRWLSLGTPASSTTKTGRHDIAEILLKVALSPVWVKLQEHGSSFYVNIEEKV